MNDEVVETDETTDAEREKKLRAAYALATKRLRDAHKAEFLKHQADAAKELGVDWKPRKSKEERAREQVTKLLADHPAIKQELLGKPWNPQ